MRMSLVVLVLSLVVAPAGAQIGALPVWLEKAGTHATGVFDGGGAEIAGYDAASRRVFVVNLASAALDVLDIGNPGAPTLVMSIDVSPYGAAANSVAVHNGAVAAAVEAVVKTDPGKVVFFSAANGAFLSQVTVGALPDMLTFTPDGMKVVVANEGEPSDDYATDPEGTVSIIDVSGGVGGVTQGDVTTVGFTAFNGTELNPGIRIYGPGATVAQDLEPEYVAVDAGSTTAWVTLQENNAMAIIDLVTGTVIDLVALGTKDHRQLKNGLDASDRDTAVNIARWPVQGLYEPDSIAAYTVGGQTFLVLANEGDAREYSAYVEEDRVKNLTLDPAAFPNGPTLRTDSNIGRLNVSTAEGDPDGDGDHDALYTIGARSISIRGDDGRLVWDSGDQIEKVTATRYPAEFNATNDANQSFDNRSDNKGPEPEGIALGVVRGKTYAFVGLERIGGIMIYDITNPLQPKYITYTNTRIFTGDPAAGTAGDLGPEGIHFIPKSDSPVTDPLLVVANEISGTTTVFRVRTPTPAP